MNNTDGSQVWVKPLSNGDRAVIFFNQVNKGNITISVTWDLVGWSASATASVRDLWAHSELGVFSGGIKMSVGPHDVFMFRASLASKDSSTSYKQHGNIVIPMATA